MKKLLLLLLFITAIKVSAQNSVSKADDASRVSISTFVSDKVGNLTEEAKAVLVSKINEITTKNGTGGGKNSSRFIITPSVSELTKDITASDPVIYQFELSITLYIGDGIAGTKFSSYNFNVKGNGKSETKAYITALKNINTSGASFKKFIDEAKEKIVAYYNSRCDFILKDAEALSGMKKYDESIYTLASVPDVCKDCYEKCMDKISVVYKAKIDNECQQNVAKAKTLMAQDNYNDAASLLAPILPDMQCYKQAEELIKSINDHKCAVALGQAKGFWSAHDVDNASAALGGIPSDSKCYEEALILAKEIKKHVKLTENREFDVKMKNMANEQEKEMATINAARDVGVAYANNQKSTTVTYNVLGWW